MFRGDLIAENKIDHLGKVGIILSGSWNEGWFLVFFSDSSVEIVRRGSLRRVAVLRLL